MMNKLYSIVTNKTNGNYMVDDGGKVVTKFEVNDITKTINFKSVLLDANETYTVLRTIRNSRKYKTYTINC